ncbi:MAG: DUF1499 domain-containing protein [Rhizobiaceae bacterium]
MAGFYERKRSVSAIWCQRLGIFSIPYFLLATLMHRFGGIQTPQLFVILAIGLVIAIIAMILAIKAGSDLWSKGHKGGKVMVRGMFLSLAVLLPFSYYAFLALALPLANDVSTNTFNPPQFVKILEFRQRHKAAGINQLAEFDDEYSERLLLAYPKVGPRRYPAGSERVFQAVNLIIEDRGWKVVARYGAVEPAPASDTEKLAGAKKDITDENIGPVNISVEVTISSLVFGYKYDSVIHIVSEDVTTLVEMRSSSRWGAHDFGVNAKIIEAFMRDLDLALLGLAGEG